MKKIVPITVTATPVRRLAVNLAPAHLQAAFVESARHAMGQPGLAEIVAFVGKLITITFNGDREPVTGTLTRIIDHPSTGFNATYLILDNDNKVRYSLYTIQSIEEVERPPELTDGSLGWQ